MAARVGERKSAGPGEGFSVAGEDGGKIIAGFLVWGIGYTVTPLRLAIRERCKTGMDTGQEVQKMTDLIGGL